MALTRVLTSTQVTISHTFYVGETATDATGDVTVTVKRLDGTAVSTGTAAHPGAPGVYSYALPPQPAVDALTVDWTATVGGGTTTARDHIEVVGGYLFELADARAVPPALDASRFPTAMLAAKRTVVEQEFERICRRAFVPRYRREAVRIINETAMPTEADIRTIRSVTVAGVSYPAWEWPYRRGPLIQVPPARWDVEEAVLEYEHGMDYPPEDIRQAAMKRLRWHLTNADTSIPSRAVSFTVADGGVYRLATPGENRTGDPDVDAVLEAYRLDVWGFA